MQIRQLLYKIQYGITNYFAKHTKVFCNSINIFSVVKQWYKARKYFKFPKVIYSKWICQDINTWHNCIDNYDVQYFKYIPYELDADIYANKWFVLNITELGWKSKYDYFSYEHSPFISLKIGKYIYVWEFEAPYNSVHSVAGLPLYKNLNSKEYPASLEYYEAILTHIYGNFNRKTGKYIRDNKTFVNAYKNNIWSGGGLKYYYSDDSDQHKYSIKFYVDNALTPLGLKVISNEINLSNHLNGVEFIEVNKKLDSTENNESSSIQ